MERPSESRAKKIFEEALDLEGPERGALLDRACAGDPGLRRRVESLLAAAEKEDSFLRDLTAGAGVDPRASHPGERPGSRIGPYTLVELIGEGGFGSVYLAEQTKPLRRRVALKIVKLGMDTRQVIARFEQERQALALMDHPNIAKVLDAGATDTGRPFFVMELVDGEPITTYCDAAQLGIPERLELFTQVCRAVQHAHTKGIIHRDIKPSNVLVSTGDGRPLARIIDFGIAKATQHALADKTVFTEHRQLVGTPEYMSPEQAAGGTDVDTRTDVYSLGVLLYELLAGAPPFDPRSLRSAAYAEMQRIIRETDPPTPSTRLSQLRDTLGSVAATRRTEPARLRSTLRGELDWIVMRALEKDRARRYQTAESLGTDIGRYLAGHAVDAAPPSAAYRLRKLLRAHRVAVVTGGLVAAALIAGLAGTTIGMMKAVSARAEAVDQASLADRNAARADQESANARRQAAVALATVSLLTRDLLPGADTARQGGRADVTVREMLDRAASRLDSGESLRRVPEDARLTVANAVRCAIARTHRTLGLYEAAERQANTAVDAARAASPVPADALGSALYELGEVHRARQDAESAKASFLESLDLLTRAHGPRSREVADVCNALAGVELSSGRYEEALPLEQRALAIYEEILGSRHPETAMLMGNLAQILAKLGRNDEAADTLGRAADIHREALGEDDIQYARDVFNIGVIRSTAGDLAGAEPQFRLALAKLRTLYADDHPVLAICRRNLGFVLLSTGSPEEAEGCFRAALETDRKAAGESGSLTTNGLGGLGRTLLALGKFEEAEGLFAEFERVAADAGVSGRDAWRQFDARSLRGAAIVGAVRAALDSGAPAPSDTFRARLREAEPLLVSGHEGLAAVPPGRDRFMTDRESRRSESARRVTELYDTWRLLNERGPAGAGDAQRVLSELERWKAEHARLQQQDADAAYTSN